MKKAGIAIIGLAAGLSFGVSSLYQTSERNRHYSAVQPTRIVEEPLPPPAPFELVPPPDRPVSTPDREIERYPPEWKTGHMSRVATLLDQYTETEEDYHAYIQASQQLTRYLDNSPYNELIEGYREEEGIVDLLFHKYITGKNLNRETKAQVHQTLEELWGEIADEIDRAEAALGPRREGEKFTARTHNFKRSLKKWKRVDAALPTILQTYEKRLHDLIGPPNNRYHHFPLKNLDR